MRILLLISCLLLIGCEHNKPPVKDPLQEAGSNTSNLGQDIKDDAVKAIALAEKIKKIADAGIVAARATDKEASILSWQQIIDLVDPIRAYAQKLVSYTAKIDTIHAEIDQGINEREIIRGELAAEKSEGIKRLRWLQAVSVLVIGGAVAFFLLFKNARISLAIGAAAIAMGIAAQFMISLIQAAPIIKWILVALPIVCIVWILVEWRIRGGGKDGLIKALKTDPISDIIEAIQGRSN